MSSATKEANSAKKKPKGKPKEKANMFSGLDSDFRDMLFAGNDSE